MRLKTSDSQGPTTKKKNGGFCLTRLKTRDPRKMSEKMTEKMTFFGEKMSEKNDRFVS